MKLSGRKLFLIGFVFILLVGIPVTVFFLQQQQNTNSKAAQSTNLAFSPTSSTASPIQKNVGDAIPLDITVDPGKNLVSFVKLEIQYDPTVLATASANAFTANSTVFPSVLEGPIYSPGKIDVTLSVGPDPTKAIQQAVTAGTVTFTGLKSTPPGTPTLVSYSASTQVLSIGSSDQASENVLSTATPATIVIAGSASTSPTPGTPSLSPAPTDTPIPTAVISDTPTTVISNAPTDVPLPTDVPSISPEPTGNGVGPSCSSLAVDRSTTGDAPYSVTFTANGTSDTGTISKVSFNFGDGQESDVSQAGGIGTATVNVQASHTYNNPGTYSASAVLIDNSNNASSASAACSQTITVNAGSASGSGVTNPSPTMPPTGSTGVAIGLGLGALFLIIGGGLIFFIL